MSEEDGFLQAILAAPQDDDLRLVYADWLEEHGGPEDAARAEFVRLTVGEPERTFWHPGGAYTGSRSHARADRAAELYRANGQAWLELLRRRLAGSPLLRWVGTDDCRLAYRRGLVAVFEGTQQVVLDAWDDLFQLGPIEDVRVTNLWHFGTVYALQQFLDRPSMRVLRLHAAELRDNDVEPLQKVSDWLRRLDGVALTADNPTDSAARALVAWLAADPSLSHVEWQGRAR